MKRQNSVLASPKLFIHNSTITQFYNSTITQNSLVKKNLCFFVFLLSLNAAFAQSSDAGIIAHITPENMSVTCETDPISPTVILQNFGSDTLKNVSIHYSINGDPPVDLDWTGTLATDESEEVTLATFTPPMDTWTFSSYTDNPNGMLDENFANDTLTTEHSTTELVSLNYFEDFEDPAFDPTINDMVVVNPDEDSFAWQRTTDASGFTQGTACAVFDNYEGEDNDNPVGTMDMLLTPVFDFTNQPNTFIAMDIAYAKFDDEFSDTLSIMVSTDCGVTFDSLWTMGGDDLATSPDEAASFTPTDSMQWNRILLPLDDYQGSSNISFAIVNESGWGNRLFVDNIYIGTGGVECLVADVQVQNTGCGGSSGSATAVVSIGTPPFTYLWNTGETSSAIGGLSPGNYFVTVTSADECTYVANGSVTGAGGGPELTLSANSQTNVSCYGDSDAFIEVVISNGLPPYDFLWSNGSTEEDLGDNVGPGEYTLVMTDATGCAAVITIEVTEPDELTLIPSYLPSSGNDGVATVNVAGGTPPYQYEWSDGQTTQSATGLSPGNYDVMVTDINGCMISGNVTVETFTNTLNLEHLNTFDLSPNPSKGEFIIHLDFEVHQKTNIFVVNTLGQQVTNLQNEGKELTIPMNISGQNVGTYFIVIQTDKGQAVKKLLLY